MRAHEFLVEKNKVGKLDKEKSATLNNVHNFAATADRTYDLNRAMMVAATSDGINKPKVDSESWVGKNNMAMPYTDVEHGMLHHAYDAIGCKMSDFHNGPSSEPEGVNTQSPMTGFKGYPRKRKQ